MKPGVARRRHLHGRVAIPAGRAAGSDAAVYVTLGARIPRRLHRHLRIVCAEAGCSVQSFVTDAAREYLRRR